MTRKPIGHRRRNFTEIPGFTDRPSLPRLGKIRLGEKKVSRGGKEYPSEIDYFRFDPDASLAPSQREELNTAFFELYGERPQKLDGCIFVAPSDDVSEIFTQSYEWWSTSKRVCQGNGDEAERLNRETGIYEPWLPCANGNCPVWQSNDCKMIARLRLMLPEVSMAGYFQIDTGSIFSSANIRDGINMIRALYGRVTWVPFTLSRAPQKIVHEGKAQTHYIVSLWPPNAKRQEIEARMHEARELPPVRPMLEAPEEDLPDDLVPATAQLPDEPEDYEVRTRIASAIKVLELNEAEVASLEDQFPVASQRLEELRRRYRERRQREGVTS